MKNLSKLSIGAVAAGAIAAPSTAATTVTVNFNLANNGSGLHDITLGGNATPQYLYNTAEAGGGKYEAYFQTHFSAPTSYYGTLNTGPAQFPTPGSVTGSGSMFLGDSKGDQGDRYLPLKFDINGTTNVGNAFFNNASELVKIDYAAVGGVPEPAIWAELVAGFGLAGAAMRRRRPQAALAA
jgi:hypothetical protein